jgi:endonuclease/exonuclease/phosphatase (EEP) superfamily protein YafD
MIWKTSEKRGSTVPETKTQNKMGGHSSRLEQAEDRISELAQYTFFSAAHGTFSKIDHILGHKASLSKYKKKEILPCILSDHNALN